MDLDPPLTPDEVDLPGSCDDTPFDQGVGHGQSGQDVSGRPATGDHYSPADRPVDPICPPSVHRDCRATFRRIPKAVRVSTIELPP